MTEVADIIRTASDQRAIADGCVFDDAKADRAIAWLEGTFNVALYAWQRDALQQYFGWRKADGSYRFNRISIWIPKKNGKTVLIAMLLSYKLFELRNKRLYSAAYNAKQAKILTDEIIKIFRNAPRVAPMTRGRGAKLACFSSPFRRDITNKTRNVAYVALADNTAGNDGIIADGVLVFDELHRMKNRQIDVLDGSTLNNPDALKVIISTAGSGDKTHRSWQRYKYAKGVLAGDIVDTQTLAIIYECAGTADIRGDQIYDLDVLVACNPVLQESAAKRDEAAKDIAEAKELRNDAWWRRFRLGQWLSTDGDEYIASQLWAKAEATVSDDELKNADVFVGFDKGGVWDFSSLSLQHRLTDGQIYERHFNFIGDDRLDECGEADDRDYHAAVEAGELITIPADAVADEWLYEWIAAELKRWNVRKFAGDPYAASFILERLAADGLEVVAVQQSNNRLLTPVITDYADRVRQRRLAHPPNALVAWQLSCARAKTTAKDLKKIVKADSNIRGNGGVGHIDSVDASINSLAALREWELKNLTTTEAGKIYAEG